MRGYLHYPSVHRLTVDPPRTRVQVGDLATYDLVLGGSISVKVLSIGTPNAVYGGSGTVRCKVTSREAARRNGYVPGEPGDFSTQFLRFRKRAR